MSREAKDMASAALGKITTHLEVCELQNETIIKRLDRQDRALNWIVGLILSGLGALVLELLLKALK